MMICPLKNWQKLINCEVVADRINADFPTTTKEHRYLGSLYLALGRFSEAFAIFSHENVLDKKALELIQMHRSIIEDEYLKRANSLIQIDRQFFIKILAGRIHDSIQGVSPNLLEKFVEDEKFLLDYFNFLGDSYDLDEENIILKTNLFCKHDPLKLSEFLFKIRDDLRTNPTLLQRIFTIVDTYPACLTSSIWLLG